MERILPLEQRTSEPEKINGAEKTEVEKIENIRKRIYKGRLASEEYAVFFSSYFFINIPHSFRTTSTTTLYPPEEKVLIESTPQVLIEEEIVSKEERSRRLVNRYLGYEISKEEFEHRFKGIDLEYSHEHMDPEVFKAFVKGLGAISGSSELPHRRAEEIT